MATFTSFFSFFSLFIMALHVLTLNCNGLLSGEKQRLLAQSFSLKKVDIILLQETHIYNLSQVTKLETLFNAKGFFSFGGNKSCGVGILFNNNLNVTFLSHRYDSVGRVVSVDVAIDDKDYRFISLYAPTVPKDRLHFLDDVRSFFRGRRDIVLGGDFNFVENVVLDKAGGNPARGSAGKYLIETICRNFSLVDPHRGLHPTKAFYSYFSPHEKVFTRIDRFYISKDLLPHISNATIDPCSFSDHSFVSLNCAFSQLQNKKGPGYWKCNISTLDDPSFRDDMAILWDNLSQDDLMDGDWWEVCKAEFKRLIIFHSKRIARCNKTLLNNLQSTLKSLYEKEKISPGEFIDNINLVKSNINETLNVFSEGSRIRSRIQFYEDNEQPSSFYARKERSRAENKFISALYNDDGDIVSDIDSIKNTCHSFYTTLFGHEAIDPVWVGNFCRGVPTLPEEEARLCEGFLTYDECWQAIQGMANNKSPGLDGLPKEFYHRFFPLIGHHFVEMVNWSFVLGELPASQRTSIITLLCKNKDKKFSLKAWRPISLLNVDYKIISKSMCNRLKKVLDSIISPDQTCSVPGRSITDNIHLLRNVIDYADSKNLECAFLSLDQEKAFDRVSHEYMFSVLEAYGFGPSFVSWVRLLYTQVQSKVLVNGFQTESFSVTRSVRQGCSLSPLLFILCLEPLAIALRNNVGVEGMPCPGSAEVVKVVQYADDTTCVVTTEASIKHILDTFTLFSLASGSKLNKDKCKGLFAGKWKYRKDTSIEGISFSSKPLKLLGIFLASLTDPEINSHRKDLILHRHRDNWPPIFSKFQKSTDDWKSKSLTIFGKAKVANVMSLSKLWYVGQVLNLPDVFLKDFNSTLYSFVWSGGPEYIRRATMIAPETVGGANVSDIALKLSAFRVVHISKLICSDFSHKWKCFAAYWLKYPLRDFFGNRAVMPAVYIPLFYKHCISSFNSYVSLSTDAPKDVLITKTVYEVLLKKAHLPPAIEAKHPGKDFAVTWRGVRNRFLCPELKSMAFRSAHHVLPTSVLWSLRYQGRGNQKCSFPNCNGLEEINHLFLFCQVVTPLWDIVNHVLTKIVGKTVFVDINSIMFSDIRFTRDKEQISISLFLINVVKRCIWIYRCKANKEDFIVDTRIIWNEIDRFISFRHKIDRKRFNIAKFDLLWGWFDVFNSCPVSF